MRMLRRGLALVALLSVAAVVPLTAQEPTAICKRQIKAHVVALDQPYMLNRLGASMPIGMVYALARDVVPTGGGSQTCATPGACKPGKVQLQQDKRPRPIVLRANIGDCLIITFTNLLSPTLVNVPGVAQQPATRAASLHAAGMQWVSSSSDDGSWAGANGSSLAQPGQTIYYKLFAEKEGTFLLNSDGAAFGGDNKPNDGAQVTAGLFGAVNVQPVGAEWYRSQVTAEQLGWAVDKTKGTNGWTNGLPFINYQALGPDGLPVLNMLDKDLNLIYTDLTAIITGPSTNNFRFQPTASDDPLFQFNYAEPDRVQPYREFSILYHELNDAQQAFPIFGNTTAQPAPGGGTGNYQILLAPGADMFAINYGAGGIGAEILGNRFGVGPMASCPDCAFEEFFLSAWTTGDPAMVVDVPANTPCTSKPNNVNVTAAVPSKPCRDGVQGNAPGLVNPYRKATKALYPDDPSNVYHSYINDHTKFRVIHAGTGVAHVHHQHAHQWLHSPNSNQSTYLDSQLINPGSAYTLEMTYNGSGNRNKVVGDSIFHCHFYPHFASGMWALWRTHDVFEAGTVLDQNGRPVKGVNRALPDPEIEVGTPIPALVPLPSIAMAPAPAKVELVAVQDPNGSPTTPPVGFRAKLLEPEKNPGFPFFIPGVAGVRAPHPPLDFATDGSGKELNGGLPRHLILNASVTEQHTITDFSKDMENINAFQLAESGTVEELAAMKYHEQCTHPSMTPAGAPASFKTNGLPRASGAPYANPGRDPNLPDDQCKLIKDWVRYKAAVVQTDLVLNKKGWHYPQSRFLTLWEDVTPTFSGDRPPQPFFFRAESGHGVEYWHTNLVPKVYQLDDWQVKTPTDVIGQHIHLVKFDVTSSDGAGNGWNYEDGTFGPDEVVARINAITDCGGLATDLASIAKCGTGPRSPLTAQPPPVEICGGPGNPCPSGQNWLGAQTTVQRWFADPLEGSDFDDKNKDRTLRTVFTHDHFSPSTHQQVGLYAALLVEPPTSKWYVNDEAATPMMTRADGGPTSWEAIIVTEGNTRNTYREFALALQDFQFAYRPTSPNTLDPTTGWACPTSTVESTSPCGTITGPCISTSAGCTIQPQLISSGPTSGTLSFNYRNEPLPFRVAPGLSGGQATDLSYVFASNVARNDPQMNAQPTPGSLIGPASAFKYPNKPLSAGMLPGDPYTPLLRAYENDNVQIRLIAGAHMLPHDFTIMGMHWLFEPSFANSGYRNNQGIGISEHFEFLFTVPRSSPSANAQYNWADYLYMPDASNQTHGIVDGMWGIFRAYKSEQQFLRWLPTNTNVQPLPPARDPRRGYSCPDGAPLKTFNVVAQAPSSLKYNSRGAGKAGSFNNSIFNQYPLQYALADNTSSTEPLMLRANAGDCIEMRLTNTFDPTQPLFNGTVKSYAAFDPTQSLPLMTSTYAGMTAGLLTYDVMTSNGINVGFNPDQVIAPNATKSYFWYAGNTDISQGGQVSGKAIEFGGVNLTPSDPLEQDLHGLVGAMVIEPPRTIACHDTGTYASATIYAGGTCTDPGPLLYRDFMMVTQDNLANVLWQSATNGNLKSAGSATISSINYRTEPMSYRFNNATLVNTDVQTGFADEAVRTDPQTPIFSAARGTPVRFHLTHPGGSGNQQVFTFSGHVWQELPYTNGSASIGDNRESQHMGSRDIYGTNSAYVLNIPRAGGTNQVTGDYLYRTIPANFLLTNGGLWGLFRVTEQGTDTVKISSAEYVDGVKLVVYGSVTPYLDVRRSASGKPAVGSVVSSVSLALPQGQTATAPVGDNGSWTYSATGPYATGQVVATSAYGGRATEPIVKRTSAVKSSTAQPENDDSSNFVDPPRPHSGSGTGGNPPPNPERSVPAPKPRPN